MVNENDQSLCIFVTLSLLDGSPDLPWQISGQLGLGKDEEFGSF